MQSRNSLTNVRTVSLTCAMLVSSTSQSLAGETCKDSDGNSPCEGTHSPCVCVERADLNSPGPIEQTDFSFDFSESSSPDVTFKTGHNTNAWRVWSMVSDEDDTPANLGDLSIDSTSSTDNYTVEIKNPNNGNAGAVNLGSAVLDDTTNWTGLSSITDGRVTGNLTGNLEVVASGGSGGALNLTIDGDAEGDITGETIASGDLLTILGDLDGVVNIIDEMAGTISISQSISSTGELDLDGEVTNQITIGQDVDGHINVNDKLKGAQIVFLGDLASAGTITIADMISDGPTNSKVESQGTVFGDITLSTGIKSKQLINLETLGNGGLIDLDGSDLAGELTLEQTSSGSSITGGAVTGTATLASVSSSSNFAGSATFTSVSSVGTIQTTDSANVTGTVTVSGAMGGAVDVDGNLSGTIDINGSSSGTIVVKGDTSGTIDILNDCSGEVSLTGSCSGDVIVGGALRDRIVLKNDLTSAGSITVGGDVRSDISISGDCAGDLILNSHLVGDVDITQDLTSTGSVVIDESIKSTGRVIVSGLLDGEVSVGTETVALSQIRAEEGLGSNGCIIINADQATYDANGIIHLGPATIPDPLNDITFDGGIKIFDNGLSGAGGDLEGTITVTGCHATSADLDICIDGDNNGTITLNQSGCTNQVSHSCVGGCN